MSAALGNVVGDICAHCLEPLELEGEFFEGSERECAACGAVLEIATIEATYVVTIRVMEKGRGPRRNRRNRR